MAKRISATDIFTSEDIFKNIRKSAEDTIISLERINKKFGETATALKETIGQSKFDSTKSIKEFILLSEKANKLAQESAKAEALRQKALQQSAKATQELEKAEQQKSKSQQQDIKLTRDQAREKERQQKATEKNAKAISDSSNAYKILEKATRDLKNESKKLGAEMLRLEQNGKQNTRQYRALATTYGEVTRKAQQGDAQLKKLDSQVGDNFRNVGNYEGAIAKLSRGLGALGIGFGVGQVLRIGGEAIIKFQQQIQDLSAITGASGSDLEFYGQQANKLGLSVEGGASSVVEAYKLIGSAKPELLENASALDKVTQSAILLSQASGMNLQDSATALTDAMNQFGASSDEASKFVNVLANGAKFGSAEIPQITESLLKFGAVAKSTNTPIEESVALIEALAERGLKGAESGTALRNIMLKLSAPDVLPKEAKERLEALGISLKDLADPTITMTEKLRLLAPLMKDNGALVKTFGTENAVAGLIAIQTTKRVDELNKAMYTNGTSTEQAKLRTNTLGHALLELKNGFIGLFTNIQAGGGNMQFIIDAFKYLGANMGSVITILWKVVRTWLIYKGTLKAIQLQQFLMSGGLKQMGLAMLRGIPMTRAYRLEQLTLARANQVVGQTAIASGNAMKMAGNSMKAIPWVLIISSLVELYNWWSNVASASAEARRQADLHRANEERAKSLASKNAESLNKVTAESLRLLDKEIRTRKTNGEDHKKLDIEQATRTKQINDDALKNFETTISNNKSRLSQMKTLKAQYDKLEDEGNMKKNAKAMSKMRDEMAKLGNVTDLTGSPMLKMSKIIRGFNSNVTLTESLIKSLTEEKKQFSDAVDESGVVLLETLVVTDDYNVSINKTKESFKGAIDEAQTFNTTIASVSDYVQDSINLIQQLDEILQTRGITNKSEEIDALITKQLEFIKNGEKIAGVNLKLAKTPEEENQIEKENLAELIKNNTILNNLIEEKAELEKKNLEQRNFYAKNQIDIDLMLEQEKELNTLKEARLGLLSQEGITKKDIAKIEANYTAELSNLEIENKQREEDARLKKKILDEKLTDDQKKVLDDKEKLIEDSNGKILEGEKAFRKDLEATKGNEDKKTDEDLKKRQEDEKALVETTADFFISQSEKKIAQIEKEMSMAEKQLDFYKKLAEDGNINAEQSLAEQQRIVEESRKKIAKQERIQALIELGKSVYTTYSSKVANKSKNPLAETIKDITLLQAFIKTIPAFEDGIEDTGTNGKGIDGKGGFHAILHPNERVIPKGLNEQIGDLTNTELAKLSTNYRAGKIGQANQSASALDFALLINEIKDLKSVVKSKPETNIELGEITSSILEIVQKTRQGNETTYNRFKIRK